jgi:guanine deaminase
MKFLSDPIDVGNEIFKAPVPLDSRFQDEIVPIEYQSVLAKTDKWMEIACGSAVKSVGQGGGPFGALLLQIETESGKILRYWEASNKVTLSNDPTAHAEVLAIRSACHSLGIFNLGRIRKSESKLKQHEEFSHCVIYSSCEPCPMCFSAISWARIPALYFAATRYDAAQPDIGFSDKEIYEELSHPYEERKINVCKCQASNALLAFEYWKKTDHTDY